MTLHELDRAYLWHPFTPMREWLADPPLVIERAEGNELIDTEGRRYLDGVSSLWVNVHGHAHPAITLRFADQLGEGCSHHPPRPCSTPIDSARREARGHCSTGFLASSSLIPDPQRSRSRSKSRFNSNSYAASRIALSFLALHNAYHGDTNRIGFPRRIDTFHRIFQTPPLPHLFTSTRP